MYSQQSGVYQNDGGEIKVDGVNVNIRSPQDAQNNGISTVYQEITLCPNLTVAENIFIGREPRKYGFIDWKTINHRAAELLHTLNVDIDVTKTLDHYSVAIQQMIAIARSIDVSAKILILDEATSSLDEATEREMLNNIRSMTDTTRTPNFFSFAKLS